MESMGKRLKRLRENRNLTVKEMAVQIGIPVSTYREWEYGREIKGEPYVKIAEVFGVSVYELLTGKTSEQRGIYEKIHVIEAACMDLRKELASFF